MKIEGQQGVNSVTFKTKDAKDNKVVFQWWNSKDDGEALNGLLGTAAYLKENQAHRYRQAAIYARMYGNISLFSFVGSNMAKMDQMFGLPQDRPTFNIVQSCVDTLVARLGQDKPTPVFLTDNGDYKERNLAKRLNNFILGEFYRTKAYEKGAMILRDALVMGTGVLKIYESPDNKVELDRILLTELLIDPNESMYGDPRQIYQMKLIDRKVLESICPDKKAIIRDAGSGYPDNSVDSAKTVSDMVMVVEGWHLKSGEKGKDGRHIIGCSTGILLDEPYEKEKLPFVFLNYSERFMGFWAQGLAEQLMGTQMEINSLLYTISKAIKLVGVPRIFVEEGSKVASASFNNDVGAIIKYRGTKPQYEVAPAVPQEMYDQLQRLINYGYQQSGVSNMQAGAQKPAGLNSGEAIRSYDDISSDRMSSLARKYSNFYVDLAHQMIDLAKDIADREGKYDTVYPGKDGVKKVDLPKADQLNNPYVIQAYTMSSLPKEPAGRLQKVTEMIQAGMISIKEGRRLLDFPDLGQIEKLDNSSEERIFCLLDEIIEDGKYTSPDPFMDLQLAKETVVKYINLYSTAKLEEEKMQMLRDFYTQVLDLMQAAQPQATPQPQSMAPQATAQPLPQSPLVPNAVPQD